MPRNGYTRQIHDEQSAQIIRQQKGLKKLARELKQPASDTPVLPVANEAKERRQTRLAHNQRHKPKRPSGGATQN